MLPGDPDKRKQEIVVCWFRRDLRFSDQTALFHALSSGRPVLPVFIFDRLILEKLPDPKDRRVAFIHHQLEQLQLQLRAVGSSFLIIHDTPAEAFEKICERFNVREVFVNGDYEPYALERDELIKKQLAEKGISFHSYKDQVIFEKEEVVKNDGSPYTVFTPYANKWREKFFEQGMETVESQERIGNFLKTEAFPIPSLQDIGFEDALPDIPALEPAEHILSHYDKQRDHPAVEGTTRLGVHLRFGTVSVRQLIERAAALNEVWLNELIWREFFMMILYHFPQVEHHNFRRKYDRIRWRNNEEEFRLWCRGETGYPLVDAGMRQLNETGWMHNRVRMVVAGFLTKHLLIDWRWGEAYFAEKLLDYELASNNGNWQWAAGTGCDAAPYFRIFNPSTQLKKFDPKLEYVKRWIKDFRADYLPPIVEHRFARQRALEAYKKAIQEL